MWGGMRWEVGGSEKRGVNEGIGMGRSDSQAHIHANGLGFPLMIMILPTLFLGRLALVGCLRGPV